MKRESPGKTPAEPPTELPPEPTDAQLRFRRRMVLLVVVAIGLFIWLFEFHHTVTVELPGSGATLKYARVATYLWFSQRREISVPGLISGTAIHEDFGGVRYICVAEGTDEDTGHPIVWVSDIWGSVWIDLQDRCVNESYPSTRDGPIDNVCDPEPSFATTWQRLGKITNASWGEPTFEPGEFKECSTEALRRNAW